jgi:AGZA family xanthine/uracil permease-like MFS transporter
MLERRFLPAAGWMLAGAVLSFFGLIHAYELNSAGIVNKLGFFAAPEFAASYATAAAFLVGCHFYNRHFPSPVQDSEPV